MRDWLRFGFGLPNDRDLKADLAGVEYGYDRHDVIQLERKDDMRKRGSGFPDDGDALVSPSHLVASVDAEDAIDYTPVHWMAA